jgi:hypothetical protein
VTQTKQPPANPGQFRNQFISALSIPTRTMALKYMLSDRSPIKLLAASYLPYILNKRVDIIGDGGRLERAKGIEPPYEAWEAKHTGFPIYSVIILR